MRHETSLSRGRALAHARAFNVAPMRPLRRPLCTLLAAITIGLVITWVTYNHAASVGRGRYIIAYGPILWGVIKAARAMAVLRS